MKTVTLRTERRTQLLDITEKVLDAIERQPGRAVVVFVPHTTAGVLVQASGEGATRVAADIEAAMERLVHEGRDYEHADEGDRNPWAHVRAALTCSSITVPLDEGRLALADLQKIFFCEFDGPRERSVLLTVI
jgi:secondary thiamine-phosphate synthase enzyme